MSKFANSAKPGEIDIFKIYSEQPGRIVNVEMIAPSWKTPAHQSPGHPSFSMRGNSYGW